MSDGRYGPMPRGRPIVPTDLFGTGNTSVELSESGRFGGSVAMDMVIVDLGIVERGGLVNHMLLG